MPSCCIDGHEAILPLLCQIIGTERYKTPVVKYVKATPAQAFQIKVTRILKRHCCYGKAVGTNTTEKTIKGFKVCFIAYLLVHRAGRHVFNFWA